MTQRGTVLFLLATVLCWTASGQHRYPCHDPKNIILSHATSCNHYVLCIAGEAVVRDCAPGLTFNALTLQCMEDAPCDIEGRECPLFDDPNNITFVPHRDFCERFGMCSGGELLQHTCAPGLHWDWERNWCNYPTEARCPVHVECPATGVQYLPHPLECRRFFICLNGWKAVSQCADGMIFDVNRKTCFFEEDSVCVLDIPDIPDPPPSVCYGIPDAALVVNPDDCTQYHVCVGGEIDATHDCPEEHVFVNEACMIGDQELC